MSPTAGKRQMPRLSLMLSGHKVTTQFDCPDSRCLIKNTQMSRAGSSERGVLGVLESHIICALGLRLIDALKGLKGKEFFSRMCVFGLFLLAEIGYRSGNLRRRPMH